jgi:hypothetical protein
MEAPPPAGRRSGAHAIAGAIGDRDTIAIKSDVQAAREWLRGALAVLTAVLNDGLAADAISELEAIAGLIEEALTHLENGSGGR